MRAPRRTLAAHSDSQNPPHRQPDEWTDPPAKPGRGYKKLHPDLSLWFWWWLLVRVFTRKGLQAPPPTLLVAFYEHARGNSGWSILLFRKPAPRYGREFPKIPVQQGDVGIIKQADGRIINLPHLYPFSFIFPFASFTIIKLPRAGLLTNFTPELGGYGVKQAGKESVPLRIQFLNKHCNFCKDLAVNIYKNIITYSYDYHIVKFTETNAVSPF